MATRADQLGISNNNGNTTRVSEIGIVQYVVLDENHERVIDRAEIKDLDGNTLKNVETKTTNLVGGAFIKPKSDLTAFPQKAIFYFPHNILDNDVPLRGEEVLIMDIAGIGYFKRIPGHEINTNNAIDNRDLLLSPKTEKSSSNKTKNYREVSQTGISNTSSSETSREITIGEYFQPTKINRLKYYEGDKLIQSRFGQSIRFSGYNNDETEFSPTIILRNRQNTLPTKSGQIIEEDINRDGSTILLSSNKYKIPFQPGVVDDKGKNDFKTKPIKATVPNELVDHDQILLNSERIILSSKSQQMLFYSRGDVSFITDGRFTIDAGNKGADLDFGDNVNITTDRNNGNFSVQTGTGNILLNTTQTNEPLIRGNQLVSFLQTLTDILIQFETIGPNGLNKTIPSIQAQITELQSQLENLKSTLNFTE
jgi:hypothetical protein